MALEGWPTSAGPERAARILDAVRAGQAEIGWCPLELSDGSNTLSLLVSCDAMKIDGVRVSMDAYTEQRVADLIGALLLTPRLSDEIYLRGARLDPKPKYYQGGVGMSSTQAMIDHSARVDAGIAARGESAMGLRANVGKDWVIVRALFSSSALAQNKGANHGWQVPTNPWQGIHADQSVTPGVLAIQVVGTAHNAGTSPGTGHDDYSQVGRWAHRSARWNGELVDLADVYTGKADGTELVSHEGALPDSRLPNTGSAPPLPPGPPLPPVGPGISAASAGGGLGAPLVFGGVGGALGFAVAGRTGAAVGAAAGMALGALLNR